MANIPDNAYYYDPYMGACEPCFSKLPGLPGNQCVYMDESGGGPDSQDWIVDDDNINPPDARGCASTEKYDLMLRQCRAKCPGEGDKNGQIFVYAEDNKSGSCECFDPTHFKWDQSVNQCTPIEQPTQMYALRARQQHAAGDPYNACALDTGEYTNCYFPDGNTCFDTVYADTEAAYGMKAPQASLQAALRARAMYEACPYLVCPSTAGKVNAQGQFVATRSACVCASKKLGDRILAAGHKKGKKKGL